MMYPEATALDMMVPGIAVDMLVQDMMAPEPMARKTMDWDTLARNTMEHKSVDSDTLAEDMPAVEDTTA